ncbi:hypothetical protein SprV_0200924000 [Sparganum proliferum]
MYGPLTKGNPLIFSSDGSILLTEKSQILKRWAKHFSTVLNRPSTITDTTINRLPMVEINVELDLPPSLPETVRAEQKLSSGKASRSDAIPAEIYKHGRHLPMEQLTSLIQEMRHYGQVLEDFKGATIAHLCKRKGNRKLPNSTRIGDEVAHQISKASQAFDRLQNSVWNRHSLQVNIKLKMYKAVVLTTALYGAETRTVHSKHAKKLSRLILAAFVE